MAKTSDIRVGDRIPLPINTVTATRDNYRTGINAGTYGTVTSIDAEHDVMVLEFGPTGAFLFMSLTTREVRPSLTFEQKAALFQADNEVPGARQAMAEVISRSINQE